MLTPARDAQYQANQFPPTCTPICTPTCTHTLACTPTHPATHSHIHKRQHGIIRKQALELQCIEKVGHVEFVGINFYSRQQAPGKDYIAKYIQRARDFGLSNYLDQGFGLTIVNQTGCD